MNKKDTRLYKRCEQCDATGLQGNGVGGSQDCPFCENGERDLGSSELFPDLFRTFHIMEATKTSEYNELSLTDKTNYNLLLSCGTINLGPGTKARAFLLNVFGAETETRNNLIALMGEGE